MQNQVIAGAEKQQNSNGGGGGGSLAWVAGIAVGIAVGGVVAGGFLIAWKRKRQRRRHLQDAAAAAAAEKEEEATKNLMLMRNGGSGGNGNGSGNGYSPASFTVISSDSPLSWKRASSVPAAGGGIVNNRAAAAGGSPSYIHSPTAANTSLYKYPSGVSGTSSTTDPTAVLDSTFNSTNYSDGGNTNTLPYSPFAANVALGGVNGNGSENYGSATLMHHPGAAIIEARNENEEGSSGGDGGALGGGANGSSGGGAKALPSNILQLLERKARTCPGSLFSGSRASQSAAAKKQNRKQNRKHRRATESPSETTTGAGGAGAAGELTGLAALDRLEATSSSKINNRSSPISPPSTSETDSDGDSEGDDGIFNSNDPDVIEPWHLLRRSTSWDGVIQDFHSSDSFSQIINLKRRKTAPQQLPAPLPPLSPLPSPLLPSALPGPEIDLDVDPSEIMGHLGKCLGTGGFGSVFEAEWRGKKVAVKMLPSLSGAAAGNSDGNNNNNNGGAHGDAAYQALLREIQLASKFDSDRLVKVYGACTRDKNNCCLIMELAENGSLFQRIHDRRKRRLSYLEILQLGHDIACGLAYLHPAVVHRDLKPQNVLLDTDGRAKLADFGISRIKDPTKSYFSQVTAENGTPMYMAPESMNGTRVDEKVDVYALGVILNEAWTRRQPWKDSAHFFQIILKVAINGERPWVDPDCPEPLKRLITKCWHQDPRQRPSCADVMRLTDLLIQDELRKYDQLRKW
jgi:hypothetical protein